MNINKRVLTQMPKSYSICLLERGGEPSFLVATEKLGPCVRFNLEGEIRETIWTGPGGVMTMVPLPGSDGAFLATHEFYSPNDGDKARLVLAEPQADGTWSVRPLAVLPYLHRFDILEAASGNWLIACTLKTANDHPNDWSHPGQVWVGLLPDDLSAYGEDHPLPLTALRSGLVKNHGYTRFVTSDGPAAIVSTDEGVWRFTPPAVPDGTWHTEQLTDQPASEAVLIDLDGDGQPEMLTFEPFHGDQMVLWRQVDGRWQRVWQNTEPLPFLHAIWAGNLLGQPSILVGYRRGARDLFALTWNGTDAPQMQLIDHDRGPANVLAYTVAGRCRVIAANRETDEVALYELS